MAELDEKLSSMPIEHSEGEQGERSIRIKGSDPLSNAAFVADTAARGPRTYSRVDWDCNKEELKRNNAKTLIENAKSKITRAYVMLEKDFRMIDSKFHHLMKMQEKLKDSHFEVEDAVKLNVGGHYFETSLQTLTRQSNTFFTTMFSGTELSKGKDGSYFIDQDGMLFRHILNYFRMGSIPSGVVDQFRQELISQAEFYGITSLIDILLGIPNTIPKDEGNLCLGKDYKSIEAHSFEAHSEAEMACKVVDDAFKALENELKSLEILGKTTDELSKMLKNPNKSVKLNVGGVTFQTSYSTLMKEPEGLLAGVATGGCDLAKDKDGCYFLDRDATRFKHVLNFLRDGELPDKVIKEMGEEIMTEAEFFGIKSLQNVLKSALDTDVFNEREQLNDVSNKIIARMIEESIKVKIKVDSTERKLLNLAVENHNRMMLDNKTSLNRIVLDSSEMKKEISEVLKQLNTSERKHATMISANADIKRRLDSIHTTIDAVAKGSSEMKAKVENVATKEELKVKLKAIASPKDDLKAVVREAVKTSITACQKGLKQEFHGGLPSLNFANSLILQNNEDYRKQLDKWLLETNNRGVAKLIHRSIEGEKDDVDFHRNCANKSPTLTLVRSDKGCIFGGFTTRYWTSCGKLCHKEVPSIHSIFCIWLFRGGGLGVGLLREEENLHSKTSLV